MSAAGCVRLRIFVIPGDWLYAQAQKKEGTVKIRKRSARIAAMSPSERKKYLLTASPEVRKQVEKEMTRLKAVSKYTAFRLAEIPTSILLRVSYCVSCLLEKSVGYG